METFLQILKYISGPVVGAVIGYFTNYLAVKMLFRPYKPKKIGKWTLPFTPGIIPKRQPQLAKAIGKAVGEELFTGEDMKNALLRDEMKESMVNKVVSTVYGQEGTAESLIVRVAGEESYEQVKEKTTEFVTEKLLVAAENINIGNVVAEQGGAVIKEKKSSLGMLGMFLSDDLINGLLGQVSKKINAYVAENGREKVLPAVREQIDGILQNDLETVCSKEKMKEVVSAVYDKFTSEGIDGMLSKLDISSVVEAKVNAMDMRELEALCMSVMKKELNAVVNLGALIGFVIGIVNIFI